MALAVLFVLVVLLGATLFFFQEQILLVVGDYLVIQDELAPVDVIHVIAGDDYRTEYAIQLYNEGYAKTIFFTGGWCIFHEYYHGQHGKDVALAAGVPEQAIAYDDSTVISTYSEIERLKTWIDQSPTPVTSVMVVSDPFHMRRARWTARQVLGKETKVLMTPVAFEQTPYQQRWWEGKDSSRYVKEEYQKTAYYILRYQLSWGWMRDWLASLDTE